MIIPSPTPRSRTNFSASRNFYLRINFLSTARAAAVLRRWGHFYIISTHTNQPILLSVDTQVELLGRAGTELILQLLGGAHRLNPNNAHQCPTVVALCGPHRSGAAGINCARQLTSHGVKTLVYVESSEDIFLLQELSLYRLTGHRVEVDVRKLPPVADLIIVALHEQESSHNTPRGGLGPAAKWASNNRASILAIEPPASGTPGVVSKYSLVSMLPLSHCQDNGRLYLCNLALPARVFSDVGITYRSPFGPKFVIPLHLNSS